MAMYKGIYILSIKLSSCDKGRRSTFAVSNKDWEGSRDLFGGVM